MYLNVGNWVHWVYPVLSVAGFLGLLYITLGSLPDVFSIAARLVQAGAGGLLAVFYLQMLGTKAVNGEFDGWGWIGFLLRLLGRAYQATDVADSIPIDGSSWFIVAIVVAGFGFTVGVGVCEEFCKAWWAVALDREKIIVSWETACELGFVCGVGFGVSEGILYWGRNWHGSVGWETYAVRFCSCVWLHGVWTAIITVRAHRKGLAGNLGVAEWASVLWPSVILHGAYDTFLTVELRRFAEWTAVGSFAILWMLLILERRKDNEAWYGKRRLSIWTMPGRWMKAVSAWRSAVSRGPDDTGKFDRLLSLCEGDRKLAEQLIHIELERGTKRRTDAILRAISRFGRGR